MMAHMHALSGAVGFAKHDQKLEIQSAIAEIQQLTLADAVSIKMPEGHHIQ